MIYAKCSSVSRQYTLEAYREAFAARGFALETNECDDDCERIALWARAGRPTHAARQIIDEKMWTSKLGRLFDIKHQLDGVSGTDYGQVIHFFRQSGNR